MSTLAVGFLLIDFAQIIWGENPTPVPSYFGDNPIEVLGVKILPQQVLLVVAACIIFMILQAFYRNTLTGKSFRAVAQDNETSKSMGITTRKVYALTYAEAASMIGIPGFLILTL